MQSVRTFALLLATGLGIGYRQPAPGTLGTLWGIVLALPLMRIQHFDAQSYTAAFLLMIACYFTLGWVICHLALPLCKRAGLQKVDPQEIVCDEYTAFPIVMAFVPVNISTLLLGFVMFRVFDIIKPWPIRRLEYLPGAWGIMVDDYMAAFLGACTYGAIWHLLFS
ncbi:phosphatidylglycerophosphatase A family protein [Lacunimicrobium album]|jgi:phosphatidylglycerophosphatase A